MASEEEKFILLIQEREILYNPKLKEHHNRNMVEHLWREVGEQMGMAGKYEITILFYI